MTIWLDGDAAPKLIKEIIFKNAIKRQQTVIIVAHHAIQAPSSAFIIRKQVAIGFDAADKYIVQHLAPSDLVITADILLADLVVSAGAFCLNPRGTLYTTKNIKNTLALRNFYTSLRESGAISCHHQALSAKEIQKFSQELDKFMTLSSKKNNS